MVSLYPLNRSSTEDVSNGAWDTKQICSRTGRRIEEVTNLRVHKFLAGSVGGDKQFMAMIERNAMDLVILFHNPNMTSPKEPNVYQIASCCDQYNIPVATNIATAESLILGLDRGDLDWRDQI